MSHSAFNPPPTAETIAPDLVPLLVQWDRESSDAWKITYSFADGREVTTIVTLTQDGVEGDAPDEVLSQCEKRFDLSDAFEDESRSYDDGYRHADFRFEAPL